MSEDLDPNKDHPDNRNNHDRLFCTAEVGIIAFNAQKPEAPENDPDWNRNFEEDQTNLTHESHEWDEEDKKERRSAKCGDLQVAGIVTSTVDASHLGRRDLGRRRIDRRRTESALRGHRVDRLLAVGAFEDPGLIQIGSYAQAVRHGLLRLQRCTSRLCLVGAKDHTRSRQVAKWN